MRRGREPTRTHLWAATLAGALAAGGALAAPVNDYPTAARADYVFGCMASNGQTQDALQRCSCSIDVIASLMPYDSFVQAETILRMRQVRGGGEKMTLFGEAPWAKEIVNTLKRAQAEAEIRCF